MAVIWLEGDTPENRRIWTEKTGTPYPPITPMMILGRKPPQKAAKPETAAVSKDTEASAQKPEKQEKP